jgi:hypothetical protein
MFSGVTLDDSIRPGRFYKTVTGLRVFRDHAWG